MSRPWPLFDLAITTPRLRLEYATDAHLEELASFRAGQIIAAGEEPFDMPASFYMDPPASQWKAMIGEWGARSRTSAEWWHLSFAVIVDGELVGQQNVTGENFVVLRTVNSMSFLKRSRQGQGIGKEMRAAVLHLAFDGLGAVRAESDAFVDNAASIGVTRALGYEDNGTMLGERPSGAAVLQRFVLTRERWLPTRRDDIEISGLDPCLAVLGLV